MEKSLAVNIQGAYVAAQEAIKGWKQSASHSGTYIYTGNILNNTTLPFVLSLGVGKAGAASFIEAAAMSYKDTNYK